jgi:hypothetical protein
MPDIIANSPPVKAAADRTPAARLSPLQNRKLVDLIEGLDVALDVIAMAAEGAGSDERLHLFVAGAAITDAIEFLTEARLNGHA